MNRPKLFALVEEMRTLATVDPEESVMDQTMTRSDPPTRELPSDPHLLLVRGVEEGRAFVLDGEGPWVVGRSPDADVSLDYDGFVSGEHAELRRAGDGFVVRDLPQSTNGTYCNARKLATGKREPLSPGDVIEVGRSLLVFRA